ncbi:hypothetical protein GGS23DRAFT_603761 [Durotheca rogersii]|uniref:uncharacterized protein n=1 Tax=Durotheca rogersii TaxID=419775 RepID=UPI00221F67BF|nr:uncharacterized protein GGS23DRAFT_603761 [Durotheca rogersii]KAI5865094.1 hypothetical protein GGS23DRAFT_603761 [Durotheca rogersii]
MLEYFSYKKVKKHREQKAEKLRLEEEKKTSNKEDETTKEPGAVGSVKAGSNVEITSSVSPKTSPPHPGSSVAAQRLSVDEEGVSVLDPEDERFLERLTSPSDLSVNDNDADDNETPPPLPPRVKTPVIELDSDDSSSFAGRDGGSGDNKNSDKADGKGKEKVKVKVKPDDDGNDKKDDKPKRFSFVTNLPRSLSLRHKSKPNKKDQQQKDQQHLTVPGTKDTGDDEREERKEEADMARVLDDLNLSMSAESGRAFSLSRESAETLRRFTQVLRDLANGVPTAYDDLVALIRDRDGTIARSYERLPRSLKKLVAQLPDKLTSALAPELLAVAAEAQGLSKDNETKDGNAFDKLLSPGNLLELVTKPGAVAGLLKGIVNALKTRWPAFVGTNVLWSVAAFLLLSALWYCYKRGRETRLEREKAEAEAAQDKAGEGAGGEGTTAAVAIEGEGEGVTGTLASSASAPSPPPDGK